MYPFIKNTTIIDQHNTPKLGNMLYKARTDKGLNRADVDRILNIAFGKGVSRNVLQKIETGETRSIEEPLLKMLCAVYGIIYKSLPIEADDETDYVKLLFESGVKINCYRY